MSGVLANVRGSATPAHGAVQQQHACLQGTVRVAPSMENIARARDTTAHASSTMVGCDSHCSALSDASCMYPSWSTQTLQGLFVCVYYTRLATHELTRAVQHGRQQLRPARVWVSIPPEMVELTLPPRKTAPVVSIICEGGRRNSRVVVQPHSSGAVLTVVNCTVREQFCAGHDPRLAVP